MRYAFVLMIAALALSACEPVDIEPGADMPPAQEPGPQAPGDPEDQGSDASDSSDSAPADDEEYDVLIEMDGGMFWFEVDGERNPDVVVEQGDRVRIVLTSVAGRHDVVIDELDVVSELIDAGETTVVDFVADETGEFEYYCSFMQHREQGMFGTFIVE